jgi:drug/metabolite transporter (DMT)-like permease
MNEYVQPMKRLFVTGIPALFVLLWSTGFIGAKFGLPYAEPYTMLFYRFVLTLLVLAALIAYFRPAMPASGRQKLHLMVSGGLIHGAYLGGVFTAIKLGMSAGLIALLVGLQPLLTTLVTPFVFGQGISLVQWSGVLLGLLGVGLILDLGGAHMAHAGYPALLAAAVALVGITTGTLYQKKFCAQNALLSSALYQYLSTVVIFGVGAFFFESMQVQWTTPFVLSLLWLVLGLSIGAILLLTYLIKHGAAQKVASWFYLVPAATALEAFWVFDEELGLRKIIGIVVVVFAVVLATREKRIP